MSAAPNSITLQLAFSFFQCPECDFTSVQLLTFNGSEMCPICAGDKGEDVKMSRRIAMPEEKAEGYDARRHI